MLSSYSYTDFEGVISANRTTIGGHCGWQTGPENPAKQWHWNVPGPVCSQVPPFKQGVPSSQGLISVHLGGSLNPGGHSFLRLII